MPGQPITTPALTIAAKRLAWSVTLGGIILRKSSGKATSDVGWNAKGRKVRQANETAGSRHL